MVHHVVGSLGYLFAVLAGRADSELLDNLVTGTGRAGRSTAHGCHWVDNRVIDNLRLWSCQLWWALKALHARYMQTGQIQHYMFIVLLGAVILGLVVLRPLGKILAGIIGRM
jgi:hypothetical protein